MILGELSLPRLQGSIDAKMKGALQLNQHDKIKHGKFPTGWIGQLSS